MIYFLSFLIYLGKITLHTTLHGQHKSLNSIKRTKYLCIYIISEILTLSLSHLSHQTLTTVYHSTTNQILVVATIKALPLSFTKHSSPPPPSPPNSLAPPQNYPLP